MSIYDEFATDAKKEAEGTEIKFSPNKDGTIPTFLIAAASRSNQKYASALDKATKPLRGNFAALGNDGAQKLMEKVFIETILKGWRHIQDKDGNDIPYSKDNAAELFKKFPRLYDRLNSEANEIENFKEEQREDEAKN